MSPKKGGRNPGGRFRPAVILILIIMLAAGCNLAPQAQAVDQSLMQTQMAVSLQATLNAQQSAQGVQATMEAQQAKLVAQAAQATVLAQQMTQVAGESEPEPVQPTPDTAATQMAQSVEATTSAMQATQAAQNQPQEPTSQPPTEAPSGPDFETFMKESNILLYEDMIGRLDTTRYVKATLDMMNLDYDDVGSAKGWLKDRLLSGGPGAKGWDLVVIAAENKSSVSGEFFEYVNDALDMGSSVILEVWYLDQSHLGTASTLLTRCEVEFERDWGFDPPIPAARLVMSHLDPTHPVLTTPNDNLSFSKVLGYWSNTWDQGDLLKLPTGSEAHLLVGTIGTEKKTHGTLAVCMDGQLTMATFSSHNYTKNSISPLWENMIYNALWTRYYSLYGE